MANISEITTIEDIRKRVYMIRGKQVMLDSDLAKIYGYDVKYLNRQVKNNRERFPDDFMFRLSCDETNNLRCKNVTANISSKTRTNPHVFTEQGIYMLSTVLRGELAIRQSIFVMRAFKEMRHYIKQNQQFVTYSELNSVNMYISEINNKVKNVVDRQNRMDNNLFDIQKSIETLNNNFISDKDYKNFVIYKGQKLEADVAYIDIYQMANRSIYVIDNYVNAKTLQLLSQKKDGVNVVLFTENKRGRNGFLTNAVISDFQEQYPSLKIKPNPDWHDRLIVIDYKLPTEKIFHCGSSSKDAGIKICAINKIEKNELFHESIDSLLVGEDKII